MKVVCYATINGSDFPREEIGRWTKEQSPPECAVDGIKVYDARHGFNY